MHHRLYIPFPGLETGGIPVQKPRAVSVEIINTFHLINFLWIRLTDEEEERKAVWHLSHCI